MAAVYVIFSETLNRFYIGSCLDLQKRLEEHLQGIYKDSFTSKANDWQIYFHIDNLEHLQARRIEQHIKKMKSKRYIENLKKYHDIQIRLLKRYR